jgi:predicted acylesterase/phospholipase RssA
MEILVSELIAKGRSFLAGEALPFADADALWHSLLDRNEPSLARAVLARLREADHDANILLDELPSARAIRRKLCEQEAMLTSKDEELSAALRHTRAIEILEKEFGDLDDNELTDPETLGIAAGIFKRKWYDLGQLSDLQASAALYERGARGLLGEDAYPHINAAFLDSMLAHLGSNPVERTARATALRTRIVNELLPSGTWWNAASRAEALFGLQRYAEATAEIRNIPRPPLWQIETSARQIATLAHLQEPRPLEKPAIHEFFQTMLPGASAAVRSAFIGKVGLALSGGGFRASFYHLGVLARLAELDVLRHVDVLSCVSGGSIVGACYWLALRRRLLDGTPLGRDSYVQIVNDLITHFRDAVARDLRGGVQPSKAAVAFRVIVGGEKGALDPEAVANVLESDFYRPLMPGTGTLYMDQLSFTPADHDPVATSSATFNPARHNWLRAHKVPALVINATTVNTGHGWQFTPTWMGESPWAVHEAADVVPRLQWAYYNNAAWRMRLGRAVAASACVPGVFSPLQLAAPYERPIDVRLVDGGVYDNQGTVALLAANCNVLIVSDAAGQLMLEPQPTPGLRGLVSYAARAMDTLMERVRQANYGDLSARTMTGLVRGMMFLHMKAGLDADPIRLDFSDEAYTLKRATLTPSGVRKDLQQALAEIRTDLNVFTPNESLALMACGYQMASKAFHRDLRHLHELFDDGVAGTWPFAGMLKDITSTGRRDQLLSTLQEGNSLVI